MADEVGNTNGDSGDAKTATVGAEAAARAAAEGGAKDGADKAAGGAKDVGKAKGAATIVDAGADKAADKAPAKAGSWPEDWRQRVAGADKSALTELERITDPTQLWAKVKNLEKKLNDKAVKPDKPGKDATPEDIAAWRKANGIPEAPDKYKISLRDKRVLGDDDKPIFDSFLPIAHEAGASEEMVSSFADWYLDHVENLETQQIETDETNYEREVDGRDSLLKEKWGGDFKRNIATVHGLFADAPEGLKEAILGARMADGRKIGGSAETLEFLAKLALELNPAATLIPSGASKEGLETSIAEIEKVMKTGKGEKYWGDQKMQDRYRDLLAARQKMQDRGKAA